MFLKKRVLVDLLGGGSLGLVSRLGTLTLVVLLFQIQVVLASDVVCEITHDARAIGFERYIEEMVFPSRYSDDDTALQVQLFYRDPSDTQVRIVVGPFETFSEDLERMCRKSQLGNDYAIVFPWRDAKSTGEWTFRSPEEQVPDHYTDTILFKAPGQYYFRKIHVPRIDSSPRPESNRMLADIWFTHKVLFDDGVLSVEQAKFLSKPFGNAMYIQPGDMRDKYLNLDSDRKGCEPCEAVTTRTIVSNDFGVTWDVVE